MFFYFRCGKEENMSFFNPSTYYICRKPVASFRQRDATHAEDVRWHCHTLNIILPTS